MPLDSPATIPSTMAKRRKLNVSSNSIGEKDSLELSEKSFSVDLPINSRVKPPKFRLSPSSNRSRYHSGYMIDPLSQLGCRAKISNILGLRLQELLEREHHSAQARIAKAQDAIQELKQIIEQIPPREKMSVGV